MGISVSQTPSHPSVRPVQEAMVQSSSLVFGTWWHLPAPLFCRGPLCLAAPPAGVRLGPRDTLAPSCSSFLQGMRRRMLQRILRRWRLRAWGPGTPSGSTRTPSAPEPLGGIPGWEASLGCSTQGSSLEEVRGWGGGGDGQVGGRQGERLGTGQRTQDSTPPSPGVQGPRPPGEPRGELAVGGRAAAGAVPAAPRRSEVAPEPPSEAVGAPPQGC